MPHKKIVRLYGLVGKKLGHSFSPAYFQRKFEQLGLPYAYEAFERERLVGFREWVAAEPRLSGLNITIPYKEEIRSYLDSLSPEAEWIGAVNTIEFQPNGRLRGHNTDWAGFRQALLEAFSLPDAFHALVLGSGGASKAVQYALHQLPGCRGITLVSRSTPLGAGANHLAYTDLDSGLIRAHTLIINTTPLGMHPDVGSRPPIPYQVLTGHHLLMDLVYNPADTAFMQAGASQGAQVQNGLRMLELQAEAAWQIWQQNPHI